VLRGAALEIVGERWSLLIVRDAFFGVRRFSDFAGHLDIPRAVLTERLGHLVREFCGANPARGGGRVRALGRGSTCGPSSGR
jgi:hypothetical protein